MVEDSLAVLKKCDGFIKNNLKERMKLRTMPAIKFIYDKSIDQGMKITEILEDLNIIDGEEGGHSRDQ